MQRTEKKFYLIINILLTLKRNNLTIYDSYNEGVVMYSPIFILLRFVSFQEY